MSLLTDDAIVRELDTLAGWTRDGNAIRKQFTFKGFPEAVAFVERLVPDCEAADHHPDVTINYRKSDAVVLDAQRRRVDAQGLRRARRAAEGRVVGA